MNSKNLLLILFFSLASLVNAEEVKLNAKIESAVDGDTFIRI